MECPICGKHLHDVQDDEERAEFFEHSWANWSDEELWWCGKCGEYFLEEDLFYTTEEDDDIDSSVG